MRKLSRWCLVPLFVLGLLGDGSAAAETDRRIRPPRLMAGDAPLDGEVRVQLRVYSSMASSRILYEDDSTVTVRDGILTTELGAHPARGSIASAIAGDQAFLEVVVDGTALPREPLPVEALQAARKVAVRGEPVTILVEGRADRVADLAPSRAPAGRGTAG